MTYFLGTVSRTTPGNWHLAKSAGLWGVSARRARGASAVEAGDHLLIWLAGRGFIADCLVTGPGRIPRDIREAPWEGGTVRWSVVVPFTVDIEVKQPVWLAFHGDRQDVTGLSKSKFMSSFQRLPAEPAEEIAARLRVQARDEGANQ